MRNIGHDSRRPVSRRIDTHDPDVPRSWLAGRRHAGDRCLACELLEEPLTKRLPSMVRVPFPPGRSGDDPSGSRGCHGRGGSGGRLLAKLSDGPCAGSF